MDLASTTSVAICGLGNVAVDCARLLLRAPDALAPTDIAAHALQQLRGSAVRDVHLIGRRGPANAAFTAKELRELLNLPDVHIHLNAADFETLTDAERVALQSSRARKRVYDLLACAAKDTTGLSEAMSTTAEGKRALHVHFFRNPIAIKARSDNQHACGAVVVEATRVESGTEGQARVVGTGATHRVPAQLVLESIGYRSLPLPGVPYDARRGVVPNRCVLCVVLRLSTHSVSWQQPWIVPCFASLVVCVYMMHVMMHINSTRR